MTALAETMAAQGLTQRDLARRARVLPNTVAAVVEGRTPTRGTADRLARVLEVDVSRLWPELGARTRLKAVMARTGLSVNQLARRAGVDEQRAGEWASGRRDPDVIDALRVAGTLDLPVAELFTHVQVGHIRISAEDVRHPDAPAIPEHSAPEIEERLLRPADVLTAEATGHEDWKHRAACKGHDPDRWWPETGQDDTYARVVCARCGVLGDCRDAFLKADEPAGQRDESDRGIWAGLRGSELRRAAAHAHACEGSREPAPRSAVSERLLALHRADAAPLHPVPTNARSRGLRLT